MKTIVRLLAIALFAFLTVGLVRYRGLFLPESKEAAFLAIAVGYTWWVVCLLLAALFTRWTVLLAVEVCTPRKDPRRYSLERLHVRKTAPYGVDVEL
jgi:hypothetical protein